MRLFEGVRVASAGPRPGEGAYLDLSLLDCPASRVNELWAAGVAA